METIMNLLQGHIAGIKVAHLVTMAAGTLIPILLGIVLPRRQTVKYGRAINKFLGLALLQKRVFGKTNIPSNILSAITLAVQTTFQDVSFGVYIDSRKDLTEEERKKKTEEYLGITPEAPKQDPQPPAGQA